MEEVHGVRTELAIPANHVGQAYGYDVQTGVLPGKAV